LLARFLSLSRPILAATVSSEWVPFTNSLFLCVLTSPEAPLQLAFFSVLTSPRLLSYPLQCMGDPRWLTFSVAQAQSPHLRLARVCLAAPILRHLRRPIHAGEHQASGTVSIHGSCSLDISDFTWSNCLNHYHLQHRILEHLSSIPNGCCGTLQCLHRHRPFCVWPLAEHAFAHHPSVAHPVV